MRDQGREGEGDAAERGGDLVRLRVGNIAAPEEEICVVDDGDDLGGGEGCAERGLGVVVRGDEDDEEELQGLFGEVEGGGVGCCLPGERRGGMGGGEGVDEGLRGVDGVRGGAGWRRGAPREEREEVVEQGDEGGGEAIGEGERVEEDLQGERGAAGELGRGGGNARCGGKGAGWPGWAEDGGSGGGGGAGSGGLRCDGFCYWVGTLAVKEFGYCYLCEVRGRGVEVGS